MACKKLCLTIMTVMCPCPGRQSRKNETFSRATVNYYCLSVGKHSVKKLLDYF